jgi:hypothetical protein
LPSTKDPQEEEKRKEKEDQKHDPLQNISCKSPPNQNKKE